MILHLAQGFGYGFAGAAQPGPFQAFLISQTLKNGWRRTLPAALAPLISDGPIIALVLLVLSRVPPSMQRTLHVASGLFILYLAFGAFRRCRAAADPGRFEAEPPARSLLKAVVMNFMSPGPYIYWSLVAGPAFLAGWRAAPADGIGFLAGFYIALVSVLALIIVVFGTAQRLGPKVNRILLGASAAALLGFGIFQLWIGLAG